MTSQPTGRGQLRRRAEAQMPPESEKTRAGTRSEILWKNSQVAVRKLLHELQVHELELEIQNDELRAAEERTAAALASYEQLYEYAPASYFSLSRSGVIQAANHTGVILLGMGRSRLLKLKLSRFLTRSSWETFFAFLMRVFEGHANESCEVELAAKEGQHIFLRMEANLVDGGDDCRVVVTDISERVRAAHQLAHATQHLRQRDQELRRAQQLARMGNWRWRRKANTLHWSAEIYRIMGRDPVEFTPGPQTLKQLFRTEDWERLAAAMETAIRERSPYELDLELDTPGGSRKWVIVRGEAQLDSQGEVAGLRGTIQDVSERKADELALQRKQAILAEAERISEIGGWAWDVASGRVELSDGCRAIWGLSATESDVPMGALMALVHPQDLARVSRTAANAVASRGPYECEHRIIRQSDGLVRSVHSRGRVMSEEARSGLRYSGAIRDITERKRAEAEDAETLRKLAEAKQRADAGAEAKSRFLASMSHEIRTPLNGVIGFASLLQHSALEAEQQECVDGIFGSGQMLLSIVNDVLDFSKIESENVKLETLDFDVCAAVKEAVAIVSQAAHAKGLVVNAGLFQKKPYHVIGDEVRLKQVLINLLMNAVKFTSAGWVSVKVTREGDRLRFSISDSGIGISAEDQGKLFQRFTQADTSTTRRFGGTGLGLAISQRLIRLMGGEIRLVSEPGKGSTFWFTIELRLSASDLTLVEAQKAPGVNALTSMSQAAPAGESLQRDPVVLLVEDNLVNQKVLKALLARCHYAVHLAANGAEAIRLFEDNSYAAVLMDCHMPVMDGFAATSALRAHEAGRKRTPVIGITADANDGNRERCIDGGMDDVIFKPMDKDSLAAVLERWLPQRAAMPSA